MFRSPSTAVITSHSVEAKKSSFEEQIKKAKLLVELVQHISATYHMRTRVKKSLKQCTLFGTISVASFTFSSACRESKALRSSLADGIGLTVGVGSGIVSAIALHSALKNFKAPNNLIQQSLLAYSQEEKDFFPQKDNDTFLIYDNENPDLPLKLYIKNNQLHAEWKAATQISKRFLFINPNGKYANLDVIKHGDKSVINKVLLQSDVFLYYVDPKATPFIDKIYAAMCDYLKDQLDSLRDKEITVLYILFEIVLKKFKLQKKIPLKNDGIPEFINIDDIFKRGEGLCAEQSLCLAYLIEKANKDGLLQGEYLFEQRVTDEHHVRLTSDGREISSPLIHIWLTYRHPEKPLEKLILDPVNKIFIYQSSIDNTAEVQLFHKYYNFPAVPFFESFGFSEKVECMTFAAPIIPENSKPFSPTPLR